MPACRAAVWPKLRRSRTTLTRGSAGGQLLQHRERAVAAAVVDEDDLVVQAKRVAVPRGAAHAAVAMLSRSSLIGITTDRSMIGLHLGSGEAAEQVDAAAQKNRTNRRFDYLHVCFALGPLSLVFARDQ